MLVRVVDRQSVRCLLLLLQALGENLGELSRKAATAALLRLAFTSSAAGAALVSPEGRGAAVQRRGSSSSLGVKASSLGIDCSRALSFSAIAEACRVEEDAVETLLMGAMARKLLRGKIDQLAKVVHLQWVRPALLIDSHRSVSSCCCCWGWLYTASCSREIAALGRLCAVCCSLGVLQDRLCRWASAAEELHKTLKVQTAELLGS